MISRLQQSAALVNRSTARLRPPAIRRGLLAALMSSWMIGCGGQPAAATQSTTVRPVASGPGAALPVATPPGVDGGSTFEGDGAADAQPACSQSLIYLLGQDWHDDAGVAAAAPLQQRQPVVLYSFDPGSLAIVRVGVVSCLSATGATWADAACLALEGGCSAPMAIDRTGTAWVFTTNQVSSSQTVQRVNTADASCVGSAIPLAGPDVVVASAFSSPGSSAEKLYIMLTAPAAATITLGQFDTQGLTITGGTAVAGLPDFPPSYYGYGGALAADSVGHLLFTDSPGAGSWYSSFTIYEIDPSVPTTLLSTQVNPPDEGYRTWMISAFWGGSLYSFPSWGNQNGSGDNVQAAALSSASVIQVLPELGASVFSASSGTACAPAASPPHPM